MDGISERTYTHYHALRGEMARWLVQSVQRDGPDRHGGGEDEANYALSFFPHYLLTRDEAVAARFRTLRDDLKSWVENECLHGYEARAEAHHGTEPFLLFLPRYLGLFPDDEIARSLLEDAAHHIGNWIEDIPPWYDWQRDVFYSYQIGTEIVGDEARFAYELAEHWRFVHIALAAQRVTGEARYGAWALRYGRRRAAQLVECEGPLPLLWDMQGRGVQMADIDTPEMRRMSATEHHVVGDSLAGIENMLASGVIYALGDLYLASSESLFKQAARRLVEPLIDQLLDPFADPAAAAIAYYRWAFDDPSLDGAIRRVLSAMPEEVDDEWVLMSPERRVRREGGVGKRSDMLYWGHWQADGTVQPSCQPSTATLTLAYQLSGDLDYARRALGQAAVKLSMARRILRGGREHADMGGAICSVAAGHGRNWGHGAVTGCYGPLLLGTRERAGSVMPLLEVEGGVPERVLTLVRPPVGEEGEVAFYAAEEEVLHWRIEGEGAWQSETLKKRQWLRRSFSKRAR
ncbi:MAG: hypothetical protein ACPGRY_01150 [Candidatus Latescibacterota bacterium]